jgi:hypothetical protein
MVFSDLMAIAGLGVLVFGLSVLYDRLARGETFREWLDRQW